MVVALRKESVDRNFAMLQTDKTYTVSLSARRAWIEISWNSPGNCCHSVALRKESVDRNH